MSLRDVGIGLSAGVIIAAGVVVLGWPSYERFLAKKMGTEAGRALAASMQGIPLGHMSLQSTTVNRTLKGDRLMATQVAEDEEPEEEADVHSEENAWAMLKRFDTKTHR